MQLSKDLLKKMQQVLLNGKETSKDQSKPVTNFKNESSVIIFQYTF